MFVLNTSLWTAAGIVKASRPHGRLFDSSSRNRILWSVNRLHWLLIPAVLVVYLATKAPVVGLIDSGELAAGCHLLNILHPTGYPLYTVIGRLASIIPLGSVVDRMAVLSSLLSAAGIGIFLLLLRNMRLKWTSAGPTALVLAFSQPVWSVSVSVEVYSLTLLLAACSWLAVERARDDRRFLLLFAYLAGLALTNHMSAASVVIGAGIALVLEQKRLIRRNWPVMLVLFALGITPYLFLVLRAIAGPQLAWGNPSTIERFWWHVTGRQYQVWMFSLPFAQVLKNAGKGAVLLARSFGYVLLPVILYGGFRLFKSRRPLALGLTATAIISFGYAINYSIPDIEAYYIPCVLALATFCAQGLESIICRLQRWRIPQAYGRLVWLPGIAMLLLNFTAVSQRDHYVAHDQALNVLASAEEGATILTDWWDIYSPLLYLQHVEGIRTDVCIIDKELVRRSWYFGYLDRKYPWLLKNSQRELNRYLAYLDRFEHGRLRDPAGIQRAFIELLESFVSNNPDRPAYTTFDRAHNRDAGQMFGDYQWVPFGLLFNLRTDTVLPPFDYSVFKVRLPHSPDFRTQGSLERYLLFCRERAQSLLGRGRGEEAEAVLNWYRSVFQSDRAE